MAFAEVIVVQRSPSVRISCGSGDEFERLDRLIRESGTDALALGDDRGRSGFTDRQTRTSVIGFGVGVNEDGFALLVPVQAVEVEAADLVRDCGCSRGTSTSAVRTRRTVSGVSVGAGSVDCVAAFPGRVAAW